MLPTILWTNNRLGCMALGSSTLNNTWWWWPENKVDNFNTMDDVSSEASTIGSQSIVSVGRNSHVPISASKAFSGSKIEGAQVESSMSSDAQKTKHHIVNLFNKVKECMQTCQICANVLQKEQQEQQEQQEWKVASCPDVSKVSRAASRNSREDLANGSTRTTRHCHQNTLLASSRILLLLRQDLWSNNDVSFTKHSSTTPYEFRSQTGHSTILGSLGRSSLRQGWCVYQWMRRSLLPFLSTLCQYYSADVSTLAGEMFRLPRYPRTRYLHILPKYRKAPQIGQNYGCWFHGRRHRLCWSHDSSVHIIESVDCPGASIHQVIQDSP